MLNAYTLSVPLFSTFLLWSLILAYLLPLHENGCIIDNRDDRDNPVTLTMFRNIFKHIEASVGLNGATSHTFRHTMGTLLNDAGADVKTIQGIPGIVTIKPR